MATADTNSALNMSLDDIIAQEAAKNKPARGGSRGRGGRGTGSGRDRQEERVKVVVTTGTKARGQPRSRVRGTAYEYTAEDLPRNERALDDNTGTKWDHGGYDGPKRSVTQRIGALGTRLEISNLDPSVSEQDIKELFGGVGKLRTSGLQFDSDDRATGRAFAEFERAADAAEAQKKYNGVPLDGLPMHIVVTDGRAGSTLASGKRLGQAGTGGGGNRLFASAFGAAAITMGGGMRADSQPRRGRGPRAVGMRADTGMRADRGSRGGDRGSRGGRGGRGSASHQSLDEQLDTYMAQG